MTTLEKLMSLADDYADEHRFADWEDEIQVKRQALEAELTRLITPLSEEQKKPHDQPCVLCGGAFELDSNGHTTFSRCTKCRHVPLFHNGVDVVAARVRQNGITGGAE